MGTADGWNDGALVGAEDGAFVGERVGMVVGDQVGEDVGFWAVTTEKRKTKRRERKAWNREVAEREGEHCRAISGSIAEVWSTC